MHFANTLEVNLLMVFPNVALVLLAWSMMRLLYTSSPCCPSDDQWSEAGHMA